jgi:hypothetical protein
VLKNASPAGGHGFHVLFAENSGTKPEMSPATVLCWPNLENYQFMEFSS